MSISKNLTRAKEILGKKGWVKYTLTDKEGRICLGGAVAAAYREQKNRENWQSEFREPVIKAIGKLFPDRQKLYGCDRAIVQFNDHPDTNLKDVFKVLDKAIKDNLK